MWLEASPFNSLASVSSAIQWSQSSLGRAVMRTKGEEGVQQLIWTEMPCPPHPPAWILDAWLSPRLSLGGTGPWMGCPGAGSPGRSAASGHQKNTMGFSSPSTLRQASARRCLCTQGPPALFKSSVPPGGGSLDPGRHRSAGRWCPSSLG